MHRHARHAGDGDDEGEVGLKGRTGWKGNGPGGGWMDGCVTDERSSRVSEWWW